MIPYNNLSNTSSTSNSSCKQYSNTIPNFSPVITSLTPDNSRAGVYTQVYVLGNNFSLGSRIGYSIVYFGNAIIPVTFYGSNSISFIVPTNAGPGDYTVQVINVFYPNSSYSNIVNFKIV
jgi:hypothetical protein